MIKAGLSVSRGWQVREEGPDNKVRSGLKRKVSLTKATHLQEEPGLW